MQQIPDHPTIRSMERTGYPRRYGWTEPEADDEDDEEDDEE